MTIIHIGRHYNTTDCHVRNVDLSLILRWTLTIVKGQQITLHCTTLHYSTLHYSTLHHSYTSLLCYCRSEEEESLKGLHRVLSRAIQAFYLIHLLRAYVDNYVRGNDINVIDGTYVRLCVRATESTKILEQMVSPSATLCNTIQYYVYDTLPFSINTAILMIDYIIA